MALNPSRGHSALRLGRYSQPTAEYFLTLCTEAKQAGLNEQPVARVIMDEVHAMSADSTWEAECAVIMPDHLHLLVVLGERLSLGKAVQRLKAKTSAGLRARGISWERNFFDRRIRPKDDRFAVFRYIYLNPYRAGLLSVADMWPDYFCRDSEWRWFRDYLHVERPYPEWLL
jgi:putative transposase